MRVSLMFLALITLAFSNDRGIPPVPSPAGMVIKTEALRKCKVPPQIAILPPQIDKDYRECVNSYYTPYPPKAEKTLKENGFLGVKDKLLKVKRAKNFIRVYELIYETTQTEGFLFLSKEKKVNKTLLCDDTLSNCYRAGESLTKKKK